MDSFLSSILSPRELLFLSTGALSFGVAATLLHTRSALSPKRLRVACTSVASALLLSGTVLLRFGL